MTLKAVVELLPGLSEEEIRQVKARCDLRLNPSGVSGTTKTARKNKVELVHADPDDWYAHAVGRYATKRGWCPKKMVAVHLSQQGVALLPQYRTRSKETRKHIEKMLLGARSDQLERIGDLCVKAMVLMIEDANERRREIDGATIHIDTFTLLSWVAQVPRALDHQFPGYMSRGMLSLVLRTRGGLNV